MTFETYETSVDSGRPVELLLVSYLTNHWYYTTAESAITHDGQVYAPLPMSRGEISQTGDVAKSSLTIKVPQDCPVGELFRVQPPSGIVTVTLFAKHYDDAEVKAIWKGRIVNAEWEQPWLSLTTENVFSSLQRTGLRRKYSTQCPHALYGIGDGLCNVDKAVYKVDYVVGAVAGVTVSCPAAADKPVGHYAGGYLTWTHAVSGYLEKRMIVSSTGAALEITSPPVGLVVGAVVSAYPGCDHLPATCDVKFNNSLNYGGAPYIPKKNPFNGSTLY